jgi:hypothetical protein
MNSYRQGIGDYEPEYEAGGEEILPERELLPETNVDRERYRELRPETGIRSGDQERDL